MGLAYALKGAGTPVPLGDLIGASVLLDPTLASNGTGSFVGGDRGEALVGLLGEEDAGNVRRSALKGLVETALGFLTSQPESRTAWAQLYAVVGDLPPYADLRPRIAEAIRATDFAASVQHDNKSGRFALLVACLQARHVGGEELHSHLKVALLEVARSLAEVPSDEAPREDAQELPGLDAAAYLLECALHLAVTAAPPSGVFIELASLLTRLLEAYPAIAGPCGATVLHLTEALPVSEAKHFWPLLLELRAQQP